MSSKILISTCFLGQKVRYDGKDNLLSHPELQILLRGCTERLCCMNKLLYYTKVQNLAIS